MDRSYMDSFPDDLLVEIFTRLQFADQVACCRVNKKWYRLLAQREYMWKKECQRLCKSNDIISCSSSWRECLQFVKKRGTLVEKALSNNTSTTSYLHQSCVIPSSLFTNKLLNYVGITFCPSFTVIPKEFASLTALTQLSLYQNAITVIPPWISVLSNINELWIHANKIKTLPTELFSLTKLRQMSISDNQITCIPPQISNLTNLWCLSMRNNRIDRVPPEIGKLHGLTELWLCGNGLHSLPPQLSSLVHLEKLMASYNQIAALPAEFKALTKLKRLDLTHNPIYKEGSSKFPSELKALKNVIWK